MQISSKRHLPKSQMLLFCYAKLHIFCKMFGWLWHWMILNFLAEIAWTFWVDWLLYATAVKWKTMFSISASPFDWQYTCGKSAEIPRRQTCKCSNQLGMEGSQWWRARPQKTWHTTLLEDLLEIGVNLGCKDSGQWLALMEESDWRLSHPWQQDEGRDLWSQC